MSDELRPFTRMQIRNFVSTIDGKIASTIINSVPAHHVALAIARTLGRDILSHTGGNDPQKWTFHPTDRHVIEVWIDNTFRVRRMDGRGGDSTLFEIAVDMNTRSVIKCEGKPREEDVAAIVAGVLAVLPKADTNP